MDHRMRDVQENLVSSSVATYISASSKLDAVSLSSSSKLSAHETSNPLLGCITAILILSTLFTFLRTTYRYNLSRPRARPPSPIHLLKDFETLGHVTPLLNFDWTKAAPRKWRPFKTVYNLTMGLQKCTLDDLITIDENHLNRILERRRVLKTYGREKVMDHLPTTHPCHDAAEAGLREFYALLSAYLPTRYPTVFYKRRHPYPTGRFEQRSRITDLAVEQAMLGSIYFSWLAVWPVVPRDTRKALLTILHFLDEDFLILVPAEDGDGYILGAFIACFPQGFDTSTLLAKKVRHIHSPVPKYREKLQSSMERYFDRLETGKFVRRVNWSMATSDRLYTGDVQTHFHEGEEKEEDERDEFRVDECFQRSEAQILFRLPSTGALVFVIKTYLYTLKEIKGEGLGPEFANAIEGLEKGNVPEIFRYKRGPLWAEKVKAFLRN